MALKVHQIKIALARRNKTGQQVAAQVGLSATAFSRLIHGHRHADPELLDRIEAAIRGPGADESTGAEEDQR